MSVKNVSFYEITSATKGYGEKMVNAVMDALDPDWEIVVAMDWSDGFWSVMADKYDRIVIM